MIHLDTNFLIQALNPACPEQALLIGWQESGEVAAVSIVAWAEFLCGPRGGLPEKDKATAGGFLSSVIPLDEAQAELAARLFNATGRRSRSMPDCLVAACAIQAGARLATADREVFLPFTAHGLVLAAG